ncbi:MAG: tetratricopeptide repeat protein [Pseudomonadota bacterium]
MGARFIMAMLILLGAVTQLPAAEPLPDERIAAYREFRGNFDAGRFAEALPQALEVLRLSQAQFGPETRQLVNPLTNLATTCYRLGQFDTALDHYQHALRILDSLASGSDPQLIRPLHGLGATYRALGRDEEAITVLKRALDISRNRDGLFNPGQLPVLRPLADSYMNVGRVEEAGKEQQYAYTVAENTYGTFDVRLLGPLDEYARWNEAAGHYAAARMLHARAVQIAEKSNGTATPMAVPGLRGIARAYRLGFVHGEDDESIAASSPPSLSDSLPANLQRVTVGPHPDGERALRAAAAILQNSKPVDPAALGAVLTDLGDWYLSAGAEVRAFMGYREAWKLLAAGGNTSALQAPVLLSYRPPAMAVSRRKEDPDDFAQAEVRITLTVAADGQTEQLISNGDAGTESAARSVLLAMKRALYRPRFDNGEPVVTRDVAFAEKVFVKRR